MTLEHVDVLIVGAGLSGIGAACHLQKKRPGRTYAILEARAAIGGTWDLFRYPGIRSDSDMFTLGYRFSPWPKAKGIADGASIREYVWRTAREHGVAGKIRFHHRVTRAEWSTAKACWTVQAERLDTGETVRLTCGFLFANTGYYRYDQGFAPEFPGAGRFTGPVVHPQHWPQDLDYTGRRVVIIGSGATAVTLVPAMAHAAEHVTMVQRSPGYVVSAPSTDPVADVLLGMLPAKAAASIVRWKNVLTGLLFYQLSRRRPRLVKRLLLKRVRGQLPLGYDADLHFGPRYDPWDQRLCVVPDGDLFKALHEGSASIVTDRVDTFTENGIQLASGRELPADVVITATGLNLMFAGGMTLSVDGAAVEIGATTTYKGMMLSGVPNFAFTIGYTNASWTLKADLVSGYVCRLLNHMDKRGYRFCAPITSVPPTEPFIGLKSGYVTRGIDALPKQGPAAPWRLHQNYLRDVLLMRHGSLEDGAMRFSRSVSALKAPVA
ncbi:NAD(P)/FAD-dependent oxidoreductase [Nonomuraea terrae]|uniref:NAD(P)/FAD-dependent oxidoreductase n=1 Tax=Nonomuraea terrae TaxID=2530383 RepID=A0A4R4ZC13_9ACTN|nr:NAD(P)/FAD-dependent oxidoreductase [Nonomuraea terrae]